MDFQSIPQCIQGVHWDGNQFSEEPEWFPERMTIYTFAQSSKQGLLVQQPYAWLGNGQRSVRINPGDEVIFEHGRVRVIPGDMFRELFQPIPTENGYARCASA
ncbi:MAG TPA: hypothetical protein VN081_03080 [Dongiaceae bacterium]|nr:hypothetical protein [Dongiaceae bacterium]